MKEKIIIKVVVKWLYNYYFSCYYKDLSPLNELNEQDEILVLEIVV